MAPAGTGLVDGRAVATTTRPQARRLGELVTAVMTTAIDLAVRSTDGSGVTVSQFRALANVGAAQPMRLTELASQLGVSPSAATQICDRLVGAGLLERRRGGADQRVAALVVTPPGRAVLDRVRAARDLQMRVVLDRLPDGSADEVLAALERLADALGAPADDHAIVGWARLDGASDPVPDPTSDPRRA